MDRMKNLLNKSLSQFVICTIIILVLTAPLFYLLTKNFYAEDLIDVIKSIESGKPIPPLDLKRDIIAGIMIQYILIFLVLSISFIITMKIIAKYLWKPFYDTLQKIEEFNIIQNKIPKLPYTEIKEFDKLNKAVSKLMHKDSESYKIQKEFTENASHELQTPIAIFQSELDILLQKSLTEEQGKIVSDLYSTCTRIKKLNKNLLLLAKIENRQYGQKEKINLPGFIENTLPLYKNLYSECTINFIKDSRNIFTKANYSLFDSLFNNLIINAIKHNTENKPIEVILKNNVLTISNESKEKEIDRKKLFQRFSHNAGEKKGNGLGLAIVKAICDFHGWDIKYSYEKGRHSFAIHFKNQASTLL